MSRKLLIFELNEVPFKVFDDYAARQPGSDLAALMRASAQFVATTPDRIHLHPKISWPTFHRGVPDSEHGILEFNQDTSEADAAYPRVWDLVRRAGKTIGIGASIGTYPLPRDREHVAFFLPDVFSPGPETIPAYLESFQAFNNAASNASSRVVRHGISRAQARDFLLAAPRLGIRASSLLAVAKQLASERLNPSRVVRRRSLQSLLTFDVVYRQLMRTTPDFATFFSNHVASSMHRYWAAAYPDEYMQGDEPPAARSALLYETTRNEMPPDWIATYKDEIMYAMGLTNQMIAAMVGFVRRRPEYRLLVITTMGQQAAIAKPIENQVVLADPARFFARFGLAPGDWQRLPGMEPGYNFAFADPATKEAFIRASKGLAIDGRPFSVGHHGERSVTFWVDSTNVDARGRIVRHHDAEHTLEEFGLVAEKIQDAVGSSGWHMPQGSALLYDPAADLSGLGQRQEVLTTAFTGAILESFGVPRPAYMPEAPDALRRCFGLSHAAELRRRAG